LFFKILILYFVGVYILLFALGRMSFVFFVVGGVLSLFLIGIGMIPILRKTTQATLEIKKWEAFKRFITDFSAMKDAPAILLHIWDEYLVYAIVLDVAKKLLKNLEILAKEQNLKFATVTWYTGAGMTGMPSGVMSPESFSSIVSNLSNMVSALSSSSSVGGGFSGGSGGGGGGGGSGVG
jgi:uncharacterized membrane protein